MGAAPAATASSQSAKTTGAGGTSDEELVDEVVDEVVEELVEELVEEEVVDVLDEVDDVVSDSAASIASVEAPHADSIRAAVADAASIHRRW